MNRPVPAYDPSLNHQEKQSEISDELLKFGITAVKSTPIDRVIQTILFVLGFGWLRLVLLIVVSVIYFILMMPVVIFVERPKVIEYLWDFGYFLSRVYIRCCAFCLGVVWINTKGKIDKRARVSVYNHQSVIDGPLLFIYRPFQVICMAESRQIPIFGPILVASKAVFVDRSKREGQAAMMRDLIEDESRMPLVMAPEGKTTRGLFLLDFRTGGFLSSKPIQPVTIRYNEKFAFAGTGHIWIVGGFLEFIWRTLSCPFCTVDIHYLPVLEGEEFLSLHPRERAKKCQLLMANDLCTLATNRNTRDFMKIFETKKTD